MDRRTRPMKIAIIGAGGMGRELASAMRRQIETIGLYSDAPHDLVFVDPGISEASILGLPVVPQDSLSPGDAFAVGVGNGKLREKIEAECIAAGLKPFEVVATTSLRGGDVQIGPGAVLCDFTILTESIRIGRQFQCNVYAHVSHDCVIGDYVTLAPKACINGNVHVEDHVWIGAGAVIKNGTPDKPIVIGRGATVGCGAVVTKDVAPGSVVKGNPAR